MAHEAASQRSVRYGGQMRAVQIVSFDGPEALQVREISVPTPSDDQVLIRVRAVGVAFPELLHSRGKYQVKHELPFTPGSEVAGDVVSAPDRSGFAPGDRVLARAGIGGYAEYAVADTSRVYPLPESVSYETGAAFFSNYGTAHFALVQRGQLVAGESVLVHGAAGGIGTAAIQVAKVFGAGKVIAVTSTAEKGAIALTAGADEFVLADGFGDAVIEMGGVDIVVDPVGGDRFDDSLRCLNGDGRLLVVGFTAGAIPTVRVNRLLLKNISVVGVGWGSYPGERAGHSATQWNALLPHLESGALRPTIGATFPLEEAARALMQLDQRLSHGKTLLIP